MAMDKYDYKLKCEDMLELMKSGAYNRAAEIADTIDWKKVKNTTMLMTVSEIYDKTGDYYRSYDVLNIAYSRENGSRNLIRRLCELAIKTGNVDEAIDFYEEFVNIAPKDPIQYILRYKILKANRGPLEQQIEALVKFKRAEYIEEWAYELARKYQEAGMTAECIEECDDLILWFNEGTYVYKAMELKSQYKPLTPSQQERYNHRYDVKEPVVEELPNEDEHEKEKYRVDIRKQMEEIENVEPVIKEEVYREEVTKEETEEHIKEPEEPEEEEMTIDDAVDKSLQKLNEKGIVQQMNLEDALMSLLQPEEYQKKLERQAEEERNAEKEATVAAVESKFENAVIPEYVHVLDEIESVIDVNLVNKMVDDANKAPEKFDRDLEELKPEPVKEPVLESVTESIAELDDETEELPSVEELIDYKKANNETEEIDDSEFAIEEIEEEHEEDESEDDSEEFKVEDFKGFEEEEFEGFEEDEIEGFEEEEEFEDFEEEDEFEGFEEEDEFEGFEEEDEFEGFEEEEFEDFEVEALNTEAEDAEIEELSEEEELSDVEELPNEEEEVDMKGNKKDVTPILPPDIQRLIDEIEGVIPVEPEIKPVQEEDVYEEPHENMGKVTEQLRADNMFEDIEDSSELDEFPVLEESEDELPVVEEKPVEEDEFADFEDATEKDEFADFTDATEEDEFADFSEEEVTDEFSDYVEKEKLATEEDEFADFEDATEEDEFADFEKEDSLLSLFEADAEDFEDENFDYEDLKNSLEREFSPMSSEEDDEREIPDDDDDIPDILSETAPLSRMETAKLHATGKTAPLPTGEISNALSMSDTGFVVQGRYDLSAQSGVGTRAGLTDEQKKIFSYFVPVRGMSEQLVDVLEQDKNCSNRQGTSRTGNLLIIGNKGNGKTVLAVDIVKAIQKQRNIHHGKVAIVTGESLNKKKISEIFSKLHGGALIIEKAGKMNEKTVSRLNKNMERDTGELLVVLEEQRKPLDRVLSLNKDFRRKFTSRLEVPILINDELVTFGQSYAEENGFKIDEMGILALYSRIDSLQREDHSVTIAEVKEVMDEAIARNQKGAAKKLVKKVFKKNTDNHNRVILSENDFNA